MECDRLIKLIKSWYLQVQDEALAPARMVSFMEKHIADCNTCLLDPKLKQEIAKITEIVLPPSKVRAAGKPEAGEEEIPEGDEGEEAADETEEDESKDAEEVDEEDEELFAEDDDI
jgi:hypothetical protein